MRTLRFPLDHSVGEILVEEDRCSGKTWDDALSAKGELVVSDSELVTLWVANDFANNLEFCRQLDRKDLYGFIIASCRRFDGSGIENILHLAGLRKLDFWETRISNDTLEQISRFTQLEHLGLDTTLITDDGLSYISKLGSLKSLAIYCNDINGAGLRYLVDLNLTYLNIGWTNIDDKSVAVLERMKSLKRLVIKRTHISKLGFLKLQKCLPDCQIES